MKKLNHWLVSLAVLIFNFSYTQQFNVPVVQNFENTAAGSTTFTNNGMTYTISSSNSTFNVKNVTGGGFNGTTNDNRFIANTGNTVAGAKLKISLTDGGIFNFHSAQIKFNNAVGPFVIRLNAERYTGAIATVDVNLQQGTNGINNGYFNLAFQNDATIPEIISLEFELPPGLSLMQLDGLKTSRDTPKFKSLIQIGNSSCYQSYSTYGFQAYGVIPPLTYNWSSNPGVNTPTITTNVSGSHTVTITDSTGATITNSYSKFYNSDINYTLTYKNSCYGLNNGSASISNISGGAQGGIYDVYWTNLTTNTTIGYDPTIANLPPGNYEVEVWDGDNCVKTETFTITEGTALSNTNSKTNVSCNGGANGTATVVPTGGTPPYTYTWTGTNSTSATATGLTAGNYSVTVKDANQCTTTANFTITQPSAITATTSQTDVSCNGGSNGVATVTATGGTGVYTYSWAPSGGTAATASGLAAGTYTVTIKDANNCSITKSVTIGQPSAFTATTSQTNVLCSGGSNGTATVTPSGGTGAYTYIWNTTPVQTTATATGLAAGIYTVTVKDANTCSITKTVTITQPTAITATTSKTDTSCNGGVNGTATVTATGGTGTLTYSWNTIPVQTTATATGLAAGMYTVTIKDANNCTITKSVTVEQPTTITATTTQTNASCGSNNGTATVSVTGGTGAYTYSWNTIPVQTSATATGLAAGTYTVTIKDANNCTITKSVTISQTSAVTATTSQTNVLCNGGANGTATVTATGGTGAYTYSWNTTPVQTTATATGLAAGTYTVTINDGQSCTTTKTVNITQPTAITATTTQVNVLCNGSANGTATVTATGGTGAYTYSWNTTPVQTTATATGLAAGTYTVTVKDANNCSTTKTVTIGQPTAITATTTQVNVLCNGSATGSATVTATGGTGAYTYSWNTTPVQTTATATGLTAGTYTVTVKDANNCSTTKTVTITESSAITATTTQTNTTCGANNGSATVSATGGTGAYTYSWNTTPVQTTATATGLTAGTYTVTVKDANNCTVTKTVTLQNSNATVAPTGSSTQNYVAGATLASLTVTGQNITWYASASNAASHTNPLPLTTVLVHNTTYYATQTVGACQSTASLPVTVIDQALSTSEVEVKKEKVSIYPNPVSTVLNIKTSENILKVMVYAADGRKVMDQKVENNQLNVSVLPSGNYLLQVLFKEGTQTFKFIKK